MNYYIYLFKKHFLILWILSIIRHILLSRISRLVRDMKKYTYGYKKKSCSWITTNPWENIGGIPNSRWRTQDFLEEMALQVCIYICMCACVCVCMHTKSLQLCPTFGDPMDCSLPGSSVHGLLQTRILEWVAMPSLQGIFPTQRSNLFLLCFLHWQVCSLPLAHLGSLLKQVWKSN